MKLYLRYALMLLVSVLTLPNLVQAQSESITLVPAASAVPADAAATSLAAEAANFAVQPNASAPALTKVYVQNVCTDAAGSSCETISSGQTLTANTYHSTNAYVFVWEIGYGTGEVATQGGTTMSSAYLTSKTSVCLSGSYYVTPCPVGGTVVGWRYVWNSGYYLYNGYGTIFAAHDTSSVLPYNTYYTSINFQYSR